MTPREALDVAVAWLDQRPREDAFRRELEGPLRLPYPPETWTVAVFFYAADGEPLYPGAILTIVDDTGTVDVLELPFADRHWWESSGPTDVEAALRHKANGVRMTEAEVTAAAEGLVRKVRLNGWRYEFDGPRLGVVLPHEWSLIVHWITQEGDLVDSPAIILVDDSTGNAEWFGAR